MSSIQQKFSIGTNDGKYQILWDISALLIDLQDIDMPIFKYNVSDLLKYNNFYGNPEYAMKTDIAIPCIIARLDDETEKLIDGNHRLYKAEQLKLNDIPCYVLPKEYHKKFILDYDDYVYEKVVTVLFNYERGN